MSLPFLVPPAGLPPPQASNPLPPMSQSDLSELLRQEIALQRQSLQVEKISTVGVAKEYEDTHYLKRLARTKWLLFLSVLTGMTIFVLGNYFTVYYRYRDMIKAINASGYGGPSGMSIAWAYVYPKLTTKFANTNFPNAVVIAYYEPAFNALLMADPANNLRALQAQFVDSPTADPLQVVCAVLSPRGQVPDCKQYCPSAQYPTSGESIGDLVANTTSGAFIGGPIGAAVGLFAGAGINYAKQQNAYDRCRQCATATCPKPNFWSPFQSLF